MQPDKLTAQSQERISLLEQENTSLRTELQVCHQHSLFTQARVAELERAHALLQAELAEEAKLAAIAREQEQAASERAATLERVNFVLQRSTERLSAATEPQAIIVEMLRTAAEVLASVAVKGMGLVSYQPASRTVRVKVHIIDDVEQTIAGSDLDGDWSVDIPSMIVPWQRVQSENFVWGLTSDTSVLIPEVRQYHESLGSRAIAYIPLRRGEETTGWIGFNLASEIPPTAQQIEMIQSLTGQIALAVEMERLAETARAAAITREQEQAATERAAELAKANEALKRSVDVLATETDLNQFIGQVLRLAAEQFDVPLVEYWQVTNPNLAKIVGWWGHERIHGFGQEHDHPAKETVIQVPPYMVEGRQFSDRSHHFVAPFDDLVEPVAGEFSSNPATWYAALNVYWQLNLPLIVGKTCFGVLNFWQPRERPFTEQQIELGYALAQQVTLAIRLSQLAEEAKQAAIAREQEKAATERAAELVKVNEVLRRTASQLVGQQNLNHFLNIVLLEVAQETGAVCNTVFLYNSQSQALLMKSAVYDGQVIDLDTDPRFEVWRTPVPANYNQGWEIVQSRGYAWHELEDDVVHGDELWDFSEVWHRRMQHRRVMSVFLQVGDEPLGFMGLCFRKNVHLSTERIELVRSLADQAALAIQLTQLAEQRRQTAVLEERNRIAREIHDTLAQAFTGISLHLGIAHRLTKSQPESACSLIEQATQLAHTGLAEARRSVWALHGDADKYRDIVPLLEQTLEQMTSNTAIKAEMHVVGNLYPLPADVGLNLLRIGQEALTNTLKYAQAQQIIIQLQFTSTLVSLRVQDDGCGFDLSQRENGGFGLVGMQQRCQRINGQLSITSQPGQGTAIMVEVPLVSKEKS